MNQVERGSDNSSSKAGANKPAVLPTSNSPGKSAESTGKQGDNAKSGQSDNTGKTKRASTNGGNSGNKR